MKQINFESVIKDGYIKVPELYSGFSNKKVVVKILNNYTSDNNQTERIKNMKDFFKECTGVLKNTRIPQNITGKNIRDMRLKDKYGQ